MVNNHSIITSYFQHKREKPKHILNIGCGCPIRSFNVLNNIKPDKYVAVDFDNLMHKMEFTIRSIHENMFKKQYEESDQIISRLERSKFKFYEYYIKEITNNPIYFTEKEFDEIFEYKKSDVFEYVEDETRKFDLIIISKLLSHLVSTNNDELLLKLVEKNLSQDGTIYLRLNGEGYPITDKKVSNGWAVHLLEKHILLKQ